METTILSGYENLPIMQLSLQLYGKDLEKPTAEEWHSCHSKNKNSSEPDLG